MRHEQHGLALRLLGVFAHPDDESLGAGGTFARYAAEGVETYLLCATRGERGWCGDPEAFPGHVALGRIRERELREAAAVLGIRDVRMLDYLDGDLDRVDSDEAIRRIVCHLRDIRPDVVITFGPEGMYGHPDHIAISQMTVAAVIAAADAGYDTEGQRPHCVSKLYYLVMREAEAQKYQDVFGKIEIAVDGESRGNVAWPDWAISAVLDTTAYAEQVWAAARRHTSQLKGLEALDSLPLEVHRRLWGQQVFYRVFSRVNGGRKIEHDLFDGLREGARCSGQGADTMAAAD